MVSDSEEKIFRNQTNGNKNCLWRSYLLTDQNEMSNLYRGPSIDASYQVLDDLAERFQRRILEINQSEKKLPLAVTFVNESK